MTKAFAYIARILAAAASFAAAACTVVETHRTPGAIIPPGPNSSPPPLSSGTHTSVAVKAMGTIPYDGFTLPLVAPDGRHVATQTGVPPQWSTLLGARNGGPPRASGIEVWALDEREPRKLFALSKGYVLTRSCDDQGFLIEAPQTDGSRRIGFVRWSSGSAATPAEVTRDNAPDWILIDDRVNMQPALAPNGAMAWCARGVDAPGFSLVVRRGDSSFEIPPDEGQSWMLPTFACDGTLFALCVRDGVAELVHGDCSDEDSWEQSKTVERLSIRADAQRAWQALAPVDTASASIPSGPTNQTPKLLLLDLDLQRMAIWDPSRRGLQPLAEGSIAACVGTDGALLWSDQDGVVADRPSDASSAARRADGPRVFDQPAVPRRIAGDPTSWILLVPQYRQLSVVRLSLVTPPRRSGE